MTASFSPERVVRMAERWFPRAVVYREWRLHRWTLVVAWILMSLSAHGNAHAYVGFSPSIDRLNGYLVLMVIGLALFLMGYDRWAGSLAYTVSGPVRRRDVLRVKAAFGVATIALTYFILWLLLCLGTAAVDTWGSVYYLWRPGPMLAGALGHVLELSALYVTALAATCACGNVLFAAAGAFLVAALPGIVKVALQSFILPVFGMPTDLTYLSRGAGSLSFMGQLSPLVSMSGQSSPAWITVQMLWFAAWTVGLWVLGRRLFEAAPIERWTNAFVFPKLWYVVQGGVALLIAVVLEAKLTPYPNAPVSPVIFALVFVAVWWIWKRVAWRLRMRRAGARG